MFQGRSKVDKVYRFVLKDSGKNSLKSYKGLEKKIIPNSFLVINIKCERRKFFFSIGGECPIQKTAKQARTDLLPIINQITL